MFKYNVMWLFSPNVVYQLNIQKASHNRKIAQNDVPHVCVHALPYICVVTKADNKVII